jgi:hypothetical protein
VNECPQKRASEKEPVQSPLRPLTSSADLPPRCDFRTPFGRSEVRTLRRSDVRRFGPSIDGRHTYGW